MHSIQNIVANWWQAVPGLTVVALLFCSISACEERPAAEQSSRAAAESAAPQASSRLPRGSASASASSAPSAASRVEARRCPAEMQPIAGGEFWVGGDFNNEEKPNFQTKVADFCLDTTEVTVRAYHACVAEGACEAAHSKRNWCNTKRESRLDHPINCVDHRQATRYCQWKGARLPTEVEWEYAARGGPQNFTYSWGNEHPDGRNCWKHAGGTCKVKSYPAGAFGLYDMTGNLWEWTQDWYGAYPWPRTDGHARVYRGGSWSRRFVKWMRPQLRNRAAERDWGSHLGFRCAKTPDDVVCPYGKHEDGEKKGQCRHGVEQAKCKPGLEFNGLRCTRPGAPKCHTGYEEVPGYGCVRTDGLLSDPSQKSIETEGIKRIRTPEFDADCQQYQRGRPNAYRYSGGNHAGRNQVGRSAGCKNRDVGAGWNSACCP